VQDFAGCGIAQRSSANGGVAYGMPLNDSTPSAAAPRIKPLSVLTSIELGFKAGSPKAELRQDKANSAIPQTSSTCLKRPIDWPSIRDFRSLQQPHHCRSHRNCSRRCEMIFLWGVPESE